MSGRPRLLLARWLRHLEQLRSSLEAWRLRVRATLAQVVSDAATRAVREAVQTFTGSADLDPLPRSRSPAAEEYAPRWSEPGRSAWSSYAATAWEPAEPEDGDVAEFSAEPPAVVSVRPPPTPELSPPAQRSRALALGLQTAAWWLCRRAMHFPLRSACGLGVAATLLAYLAGPAVALSGVGLLGALLSCCLATES